MRYAVPPAPGVPAYDQLPPVSMPRTAGVPAHGLQRQISYGDLTADDVMSITCASAIGQAVQCGQPLQPVPTPQVADADDESTNSDTNSSSGTDASSVQCNPFVDDIAEEGSDGSSEVSGSGDDTDYLDAPIESNVSPHSPPQPLAPSHRMGTPDSSAVVAHDVHDVLRTSSRSRTKTEKGRLQQGHASDLASTDDVRNDPSVAFPMPMGPRVVAGQSLPDPDTVHGHPAKDEVPTVYLEDLDGPPLGVPKRIKVKSRNGPSRGANSAGRLQVQTDLASLVADVPGAEIKSLVLSPPYPDMTSHDAATLMVPDGLIVSTASVASRVSHTLLEHAMPLAMMAVSRNIHPELAIVPSSVTGVAASSLDVLLSDLDALIGCVVCPLLFFWLLTQPMYLLLLFASFLSGVHTVSDTYRESSPEEDDEESMVNDAMPSDVGPDPDALLDPWLSWDELEELELHVMLPEVQETHLRPLYALLPTTGPYCSMVLCNQTANSFGQPPYLRLDHISSMFNKDCLWYMFLSLVILIHLAYCVPPPQGQGILINDGLKCLLAGQTVVSMVTSVVVDSFLIKAFHPDPSPAKLTQWSSVGLSSKSTTNSWPHSPSKPATLSSHNQRGYYHCLGFTDEVPVFDGRSSHGRHFLFRNEDFDNLTLMCSVTASDKRLVGGNDLQPTLNLSQLYTITN
ncbi:hypothetical protein EV421DRAFT_1907449 [Armillaria borealis]|uniref:Uncharacterized protein n=1 Tax=Armillaria borealis TaxID=47425 RepID=A0AA39J6P8_9AGAR|nr:hypothetical protein EV421DRAFT_1907449 [Armillaria borealis]